MTSFPRKAMILAAGLGTRLRPLSEAMPKPAVPLCGIAPLRWNLALLAGAGVKEVVVNTHWRAEEIRRAAGDPSELGLEVVFSHEPEILGTGGGLRKVASHFQDETFLLVNGKLLFDADLEAAVSFHRERRALATMMVRPYPRGSGYGAVEVDSEGRIRRFNSSPDEGEEDERLSPRLFTGVHVLEPAVLDYLPAGGPACVKVAAYIPMIESDERIFSFVQEAGYWAEPSTPERYLATVLDVLRGRVGLTRFVEGGLVPFEGCAETRAGVRVHESASVDPGARLEGPCWIGPGARVEGGALVGAAAIEAGAIVGEGARVEESVVWPGTALLPGERLERSIAVSEERIGPL